MYFFTTTRGVNWTGPQQKLFGKEIYRAVFKKEDEITYPEQKLCGK